MSTTSWEIQHYRAAQYQKGVQERQMVGVISTLGVLGVVGGVVGGICAGPVGVAVGSAVGFGCFYVVAKHGSDAVENIRVMGEGVMGVGQNINYELSRVKESLEETKEYIIEVVKDSLRERKPHKQPESSCVPSDGQSFSDLWMRLAEECCVGRKK